MPGDETKIKLERLIERFFTGRVVPFIGAGVSINAVHEDGRKGLADSSRMVKAIVSELRKLRIKAQENEWIRWICRFLECELLDRDRCEDDKCLLKQLSNPSESDKYLNKYAALDKLCEIYTWASEKDSGDGKQASLHKLVFEVLLIPEFSELQPQPAQRYISFLAREKLIDEIITTNYDCCFEKAFQQTFQDRPADTALVITDLDEYRRFSGKFYASSGSRCLKIYKINGCAGKLKKSTLKQEDYPPEKILLMERQLQSWRERSWARDLFHDCLRSRTLLFSGFGSEEPQVRHTALQISEEFQNTGDNKADTDQVSCWDLPNAPFIAAFENILSFNQLQILYSYASAHNSSLEYKDIHSNVFMGTDRKFLDSETEQGEPTLSADLFWEKVYQAAFWRLFKEHCRPDTTFYAYLSSRIYTKDALLFRFINWLVPDDQPFGRFPQLLKLNGNGVNTLTTWLNCIRYGRANGGSTPVQGLYLPLIENPLLFPLLLLILFFAAGDKDSWEDIKQMIETKNSLFIINAVENLPLYIAYSTSLLENALNNVNSSIEDVGVAVIIDEKLEERPAVIYRTVVTSSACHGQKLLRRKRVCIYKLPIRDVFYWEAKISAGTDSPREKFFAALREAKLITADACSRVRKRAKRI